MPSEMQRPLVSGWIALSMKNYSRNFLLKMNEEKNIEESSKPQAASDKLIEGRKPQASGNEPKNSELKNEQLETKQETSNQQPATEKMEVHKHPHHVTHKKKWGEYLLEFLMLFLAVFLGFLAENLREQTVEHHREKEYVQSLVEDLKSDTLQANEILIKLNNRSIGIDSVITAL